MYTVAWKCGFIQSTIVRLSGFPDLEALLDLRAKLLARDDQTVEPIAYSEMQIGFIL